LKKCARGIETNAGVAVAAPSARTRDPPAPATCRARAVLVYRRFEPVALDRAHVVGGSAHPGRRMPRPGARSQLAVGPAGHVPSRASTARAARMRAGPAGHAVPSALGYPYLVRVVCRRALPKCARRLALSRRRCSSWLPHSPKYCQAKLVPPFFCHHVRAPPLAQPLRSQPASPVHHPTAPSPAK
jgi:hypothetical protein